MDVNDVLVDDSSSVAEILKAIDKTRERFRIFEDYFHSTKGHAYVRKKHVDKHQRIMDYLNELISKRQHRDRVPTSPRSAATLATGINTVEIGKVVKEIYGDAFHSHEVDSFLKKYFKRLVLSRNMSDTELIKYTVANIADIAVTEELLHCFSNRGGFRSSLSSAISKSAYPDLTELCLKALKSGDRVSTKLLVKHGKIDNSKKLADPNEFSLVKLAIKNGWRDTVEVMLQSGANLPGDALHDALILSQSPVEPCMIPLKDNDVAYDNDDAKNSFRGLRTTFSSLICDACVNQGNWYYETRIPLELLKTGHDVVRVGWACGDWNRDEVGSDDSSWGIGIVGSNMVQTVANKAQQHHQSFSKTPMDQELKPPALECFYFMKYHNGHYQKVFHDVEGFGLDQDVVLGLALNVSQGEIHFVLNGSSTKLAFDTLPTKSRRSDEELLWFPVISIRHVDAVDCVSTRFQATQMHYRPSRYKSLNNVVICTSMLRTLLNHQYVDVNDTSKSMQVGLNVRDVTGEAAITTIKLNVSSVSPLLHALYLENDTLALYILEHPQTYVDHHDSEHITPIFMSCLLGFEQVTAKLLQKGCDVNIMTSRKLSPLHAAIYNSHESCACLVLETRGESIDHTLTTTNRCTALILAIRMNMLKLTRLLLKIGASHTTVDAQGITPLIAACMKTNEQCALSLLELCPYTPYDLNVRDRTASHGTAIMYAASNGLTATCKEMLRLGADANVTTDDGVNMLFLSILEGHEDTALAILMSNKIDSLQASDSKGNTVFMIACEKGMSTLVAELLKRGCDVNAPNKAGYSPILLSLSNASEDTAKQLFQHAKKKLKVELSDRNGENALMWAMKNGHVDTVETLLTLYDMDPNAMNITGTCALAIGIQHDHETACLRLLQCSKQKVVITAQYSPGVSLITAAFQKSMKKLCAYLYSQNAPCEDETILHRVKTNDYESSPHVKISSQQFTTTRSRGSIVKPRQMMASTSFGVLSKSKHHYQGISVVSDKDGICQVASNSSSMFTDIAPIEIKLGAQNRILLKDINAIHRTIMAALKKEFCLESIVSLITQAVVTNESAVNIIEQITSKEGIFGLNLKDTVLQLEDYVHDSEFTFNWEYFDDDCEYELTREVQFSGSHPNPLLWNSALLDIESDFLTKLDTYMETNALDSLSAIHEGFRLAHVCIVRDLPRAATKLLSMHCDLMKVSEMNYFVFAVMHKNAFVAEWILAEKPEIVLDSASYRTPEHGDGVLHIAIAHEMTLVVKRLLHMNFDVFLPNNRGVIPLELLCSQQVFVDVGVQFLDRLPSIHKGNILRALILSGQTPALLQALQGGGFKEDDLDRYGNPLIVNVGIFAQNILDSVKALVVALPGIDLNVTNANDGKSLLHYVCERGILGAFEGLINVGCSSFPDSQGRTPLESFWMVNALVGRTQEITKLLRATEAKARRRWIANTARLLPDGEFVFLILSTFSTMPSILVAESHSESWSATCEFWLAVLRVLALQGSEGKQLLLRRLSESKVSLFNTCPVFAIYFLLVFAHKQPEVPPGTIQFLKEEQQHKFAVESVAPVTLITPMVSSRRSECFINDTISSHVDDAKARKPKGKGRSTTNAALTIESVADKILDALSVDDGIFGDLCVWLCRFGMTPCLKKVHHKFPDLFLEMKKKRHLAQIAAMYAKKDTLQYLVNDSRSELISLTALHSVSLTDAIFLGPVENQRQLAQYFLDMRMPVTLHFVKYLLEESGGNIRTTYQDTLLHLAVLSNDSSIVRSVVERLPRCVGARNIYNMRPIEYCTSVIIQKLLRSAERKEGFPLSNPEIVVELKITERGEDTLKELTDLLEANQFIWDIFDPTESNTSKRIGVSLPLTMIMKHAPAYKIKFAELKNDKNRQVIPTVDFEMVTIPYLTRQMIVLKACGALLSKFGNRVIITPCIWYGDYVGDG
eukprot:PhF_6_TR27155/c0_g1_i1/m.39700